MAIVGDLIAVGASNESGSVDSTLAAPDDDALAAGAVYLFRRQGGGRWRVSDYVKAPNAEALDQFGTEIALAGETLAVTAAGEAGDADSTLDAPNSAQLVAGAVYTYTQREGEWVNSGYLKAPNTGQADAFGSALALSGDRLAIGAWGESGSRVSTLAAPDDGIRDSGAVYLYRRGPDGWRPTAYIKAPDARNPDRFGTGVALEGDTLAVGANGHFGGAETTLERREGGVLAAGAAYIIEL